MKRLILRRFPNVNLQIEVRENRSVSTLSKPRALARGASNGLIILGACLASMLCGCASNSVKATPLPVVPQPEPQATLKPKMTPEEVMMLMGKPDKPILIYFYPKNKESLLGRLSKDNYTPFIFVDNKLEGWGWNYLNQAAKNIINN